MLCGKHTDNKCYHCALDKYGQHFIMLYADTKTYKGFMGYFPKPRWIYKDLILKAFDKGLDTEPFVWGVINRCVGWDFDLLLRLYGEN